MWSSNTTASIVLWPREDLINKPQWTVNVCFGNIDLIVTGTSASSNVIESRASSSYGGLPALRFALVGLMVCHGLDTEEHCSKQDTQCNFFFYRHFMSSTG
jgi:hypothetical protein